LSSEFQATLRRLKPDKHRHAFKPRAESDLDFLGSGDYRPAKLPYDTTVYVDILQDRFPQDGERMLRATEAWHSPVTEAELAAACGMLDPAHPGTRQIVERIEKIIERRWTYQMIIPNPDIWREAGILAGVLARLQGYGKDQRRRILNDALLFASARKYGCAVLTGNLTDFDFLQQLDPSGKVCFTSRTTPRGERVTDAWTRGENDAQPEFVKLDIGRVRRRTSRKARSITLMVRTFFQCPSGMRKKFNNCSSCEVTDTCTSSVHRG
jgi:predicted nucleic acid-binding protein